MVFTGIVEELGTVQSITNLHSEQGGVNLVVSTKATRPGVKVGDSICVNGACLTVTHLTDDSFTFGIEPETLRCTTLGTVATGSRVNLERGLPADGRFGGHVVQGHVDCTGQITELSREKDSLWFTVRIPSEMMMYIVEKGYITVDGTSLTVCNVMDNSCSFSFMMIPHTQAVVVTALKGVHDMVNIEVDITGKYIQRILSLRTTVQ